MRRGKSRSSVAYLNVESGVRKVRLFRFTGWSCAARDHLKVGTSEKSWTRPRSFATGAETIEKLLRHLILILVIERTHQRYNVCPIGSGGEVCRS